MALRNRRGETQQQNKKRNDTAKGLVTARQRRSGSVTSVPFSGGNSRRRRKK